MLTSRVSLFFTISVISFCAFCNELAVTEGDSMGTLSATSSAFYVSAEIRSHRYKKIVGKEYTFVYGIVNIQSKGTTEETFNLETLALLSNGVVSKGANIDSIGYFIPQINLQPDQLITRKVYWVFDGYLSPSGLKELSLIVRLDSNGPKESMGADSIDPH